MPDQNLQNFIDLLNKKSELTSAEIEVQDKYFRSQIYGTQNSGEVRAKLKDFFFTEPKDTIEKSKRFWYSYWRWYSMLNWAGFIGLSEADMLFSIAYQVPMAVALDFNPADELRRWLALNCPYEEETIDLYTKAQAAFLGSEGYVGMSQSKEVYFPELMNEIADVGFEEDTLRQAEFENKLAQLLFPSNELVEKYFFTDSDTGVKRFVSLAVFLQSVEKEEIWLAVDNFMYPEKYINKVLAEISSTAVSAVPVKSAFRPAPATRPPVSQVAVPKSVVPSESVVKPIVLAKPTPQRTLVVEPQARLTTGQVKSQIESAFSTEDVEGIMGKLNELAEKNNDPKIAEMYYFDEKENKFKWNI